MIYLLGIVLTIIAIICLAVVIFCILHWNDCPIRKAAKKYISYTIITYDESGNESLIDIKEK